MIEFSAYLGYRATEEVQSKPTEFSETLCQNTQTKNIIVNIVQ